MNWTDEQDVENGFVDITHTTRLDTAEGGWRISVGPVPPFGANLDEGVALTEYGLVFETDGDGNPDYEIGYNGSSWIRDLESGITQEQVGNGGKHPSDYWVEFSYPGDAISMLFRRGKMPVDQIYMDSGSDYQYYAWSYYSENGSVVAWDYAPDFGWLAKPDCADLPAPLPGRTPAGRQRTSESDRTAGR
jgi:hypothetical protein